MKYVLPLVLLLTGCGKTVSAPVPPAPELATVTFTWPDFNAWHVLTCRDAGRWEVGVKHSYTVSVPPGPYFCVLELEQAVIDGPLVIDGPPVIDGPVVIAPGALASWSGTVQPGAQTVAMMLETR